VEPGELVGIGVDATSATVFFTDEDGVPLCEKPGFENNVHAYVKLWKHHGAQDQATRLVKVPERFGGPQCRNGDISLTSNPGAPPPGALIGKFGTERHMPVPATSLVLLRQKKELILVVGPSKASTRFDDVGNPLVTRGSRPEPTLNLLGRPRDMIDAL